MPKTISAIEYERISKENLTESSYKQLKELCLDEEYQDIMSYYNGKICFKNYAGIMQLKNGDFIEVLPKICFDSGCITPARKIFTKMIATLKSDYYKSFSDTNISCEKFPLLEIFITIFLNELDTLIKLGLRKNYIKITENSNFVKGKLKNIENIKYNHSHKELNFIEYSKFVENIPENILLKTCICLLKNKAKDIRNIKRLTQALFLFDNVDLTYCPETEFKKITLTRLNKYYESPLELAHVFLLGNSFLTKQGSTKLISLMFPLEKLFEDYVFYKLKKDYKNHFKSIKAQSNPYYLLESENKFKLKPDIVMESDDRILILDTKWKLLDSKSFDKKYGVSQSDLYQLYAYGKKYKQKNINKAISLYLIYPKTERFDSFEQWNYENDKSLPIILVPYDLENDELRYELLSDNFSHI